ncbi:MAG: MoaD/ThiS family protein [Mariprofundus sp.]|nr:MoaD/ThiS family protein [Mariprofundus sp.]
MIKILFFGSIADKLGKRECSLPAHESMTVTDVMNLVGCDDFKVLFVAVNQTQINDMKTLINDGDEVALMPPFSGG